MVVNFQGCDYSSTLNKGIKKELNIRVTKVITNNVLNNNEFLSSNKFI